MLSDWLCGQLLPRSGGLRHERPTEIEAEDAGRISTVDGARAAHIACRGAEARQESLILDVTYSMSSHVMLRYVIMLRYVMLCYVL